jgi:hypothetical protein
MHRGANTESVPDTILIERRYRGPEESGNGGYTCGLVAAFLGGEAEVTLRRPPPLETPLRVERDDDGHGVRVLDGTLLVAEARGLPLELAAPQAVPFDVAAERAARLPAPVDHPFPSCFVCGPARRAGDALRLVPVPVDGGRVAAAWTVGEDQGGRPEIVWAALDCPGAFAVDPRLERGVSVLGRLHARVDDPPEAGERCVVVGWPLAEHEGRKHFAGTALFGEDGRLLGLARATWITIAGGAEGTKT